jgi:RHS repeat-associated protein
MGPQAAANPYRFSSKEYHPLSGLYAYGRRFYDPSFQRWVNLDPLNEAGGVNLYQFAGNDPLNRIDPFGLAWSDYNPLLLFSGNAWGSLIHQTFVGDAKPVLDPDSYAAQRARQLGPIGTFRDEAGNTATGSEVLSRMAGELMAAAMQYLAGRAQGAACQSVGGLRSAFFGRPAAENAAVGVERIRHYTSPEALRSIRRTEQLVASRPVENPGVWFARRPFPASRFNPQVGSAGRGAYVEINAPSGMRSLTFPGERPWGFIPTGGAPLNIGDLKPTYVGSGPFGLW